MNTKQTYQKPEIEVIELQMEAAVFAASETGSKNSLNYSNERTEGVNEISFWDRTEL